MLKRSRSNYITRLTLIGSFVMVSTRFEFETKMSRPLRVILARILCRIRGFDGRECRGLSRQCPVRGRITRPVPFERRDRPGGHRASAEQLIDK
ncbi:hypothetical protein PUN28_020273 [Cardiocondyla obscurior]|uniref:Secreted protein n=1 Tax=Cardiocondyla obscurior TaxID=286306 RepID=A0AAW2E9Q7_9HYME